ncbi:MAG: MBL fold metallo-hydrolase [Deltaproteobacteria bacterium]|nr:MBL fold metallo-hydrolase [Deltaproteobacteria bacterium]
MSRRVFTGIVLVLAVLLSAQAAVAICNPNVVKTLDAGPHLARSVGMLAGATAPGDADIGLGQYSVRWFGHSSFAIRSGTGTRVVADPNFDVTPGITADAVTVSNDHYTHNNVEAVRGEPLVLRGITLDQRWQPVRRKVRDIVVVNLPSARSYDFSRIANSIFVFEMGSLCLAHLGNIGHLLTEKQVKLLRRVDVMMVPIDARNNLGFGDLVKVIEQVKPPIVLPMHYDNPYQAEYFASHINGRYPVRPQADSRLVLTRKMLPKSTELFILPHPNPYAVRRRWWGGSDDDR